MRSRLDKLRAAKGAQRSYKIVEDKNAGPAQEKQNARLE